MRGNSTRHGVLKRPIYPGTFISRTSDVSRFSAHAHAHAHMHTEARKNVVFPPPAPLHLTYILMQAVSRVGSDVPKALDWLVEQNSWTTVPAVSTMAEGPVEEGPTATNIHQKEETSKKKKKGKEKLLKSKSYTDSNSKGSTSSSLNNLGNVPSTPVTSATPVRLTHQAPTALPLQIGEPPSANAKALSSIPLHPHLQSSSTTPPAKTPKKIELDLPRAPLPKGGLKGKRRRTVSEPCHVSFNLQLNDVQLYTPRSSPVTEKKGGKSGNVKRKVKVRQLSSVKRRLDGPEWSLQEHLKTRRERTQSCSSLLRENCSGPREGGVQSGESPSPVTVPTKISFQLQIGVTVAVAVFALLAAYLSTDLLLILGVDVEKLQK